MARKRTHKTRAMDKLESLGWTVGLLAVAVLIFKRRDFL